MTSRLSKNRPITRRNTLRWNRLKAVVLSATVLLNLAPSSPAADPPAGRGSAAQPAAERWKRLKNQYEFTPAPVTTSPRSEQPVEVPASGTTIRTLPDEPKANLRALPASLEQSAAATESTPLRTAAAPTESKAAESDFADPFSTESEPVLSLPEEPTAAIPQQSEVPPAAEVKQNSQEPAAVPKVGTRRLMTSNPAGPPRKTTQIRRISDIAPLNDFDKNIEIKTYAAEKAREFNVKFGGEEYTPRNFPDTAVPWAAPSTKYYPLYFQDPALERYGHTHHHLLQPVISSARMTTQLVMLPYQMTITPPWCLQSPLGWYRPGDVVPKLKYPIPWSAKAAAVEAASLTGLIFLVQ